MQLTVRKVVIARIIRAPERLRLKSLTKVDSFSTGDLCTKLVSFAPICRGSICGSAGYWDQAE